MINKMNKNKHQILELMIIFIITILFNLLCNGMERDEIWNYGFSYNIATGLIPYKDFNMVITPLFPMIGSLFIYIFGKNILIYYIFNSIICTIIFYHIKRTTSQNYYLVYIIVLFFSTTNYNLFCLLLLYIIINLEEKNANDYLIGILLGLTFLTKQNIGIFLCLPTFLIKNKKRILKRIFGFLVPNILLLIYLLINNALYEFIDYVFLGINDFASKNTIIYPKSLMIHIITIIYLIFKYLKTKDIKLLYILCFQGMAYPIYNSYHVIIPFIPAFAYFINDIKLNTKIINTFFIIIVTIIFSINIYQIFNNNYNYPNETIHYKYKKIPNEIVNTINILSNYLKNIEGQIFIIDIHAYLLKLESSIPINKYDLLNDGNLGQGGKEKILQEIDNICQKEKCTFLLNKNKIDTKEYDQYSQDLYQYVIKNYNEIKTIEHLTIYEN